jgi:hypothetical protein
MKKILLGIVILVLVLAVVAVIVVGLSIDKIVKVGVETIGPKIVLVPIKLDEVKLALLTGSAKANGLVVGNPEGYKTPFAISVGTASVNVDPFSILKDKIVVRSIVVQSPEITFEGGLIGDNNLGKIMNNIDAVIKSGGSASTNKTAAAANGKPAKKIEVDDFLITGAKVHGTLILFGKEITLPSLPLPDIHLTNLGTDPDGITATDLTRHVFEAITSATIKAVAKFGENIGGGAENLGGAGVDKLKNGLGGLLGK